jgi:hypothetical protein
MRGFLAPIFVTVALAMAGCNQAKSPDDVAKDVAQAEQKASDEVIKSEDRAANSLDKAAGKVDEQLVHFNNDASRQAYDVAIAQADGNRKVALASCESRAGDAQKACKNQAESDYQAARAQAMADNVASNNEMSKQ